MCESSRDGPDGEMCHIWAKTGKIDFSKFSEISANFGLFCGLLTLFGRRHEARGREIFFSIFKTKSDLDSDSGTPMSASTLAHQWHFRQQ